jgi:primase-polymerase (primpol)-like protein
MKAYGTGKSIITVISENIPDELEEPPTVDQLEAGEARRDLTKVPYKPGTGAKASSIDLLTWGTFEEAIEVLERYEGVGFVFCSADPYVGWTSTGA